MWTAAATAAAWMIRVPRVAQSVGLVRHSVASCTHRTRLIHLTQHAGRPYRRPPPRGRTHARPPSVKGRARRIRHANCQQGQNNFFARKSLTGKALHELLIWINSRAAFQPAPLTRAQLLPVFGKSCRSASERPSALAATGGAICLPDRTPVRRMLLRVWILYYVIRPTI